jgi:hypothetical protein
MAMVCLIGYFNIEWEHKNCVINNHTCSEQLVNLYGQQHNRFLLSNIPIRYVLYDEGNKVENLLVKFDRFL